MSCQTTMIDTASDSRDVCTPLLNLAGDCTQRIAVDLEGWDLGPGGKIGVVTLAVSDVEVYLFDFADRDDAKCLLNEGLLSDVLSHPNIEKIMFDCRMDVGALFHQYGVKVTNVLDLQVPAARRFMVGCDYLMGMFKVFNEKLRLLSSSDSSAKSAGRHLFAPEVGGDYQVWFKRPMSVELKEYCSVDVKHFFAACNRLIVGESAMNDCRKVSTARATKCIEGRVEKSGARRDF